MDCAEAASDAMHKTAAMHSVRINTRFIGDLLVGYQRMLSLDRELDSNTAGRPECRDVPLVHWTFTAQKYLPAVGKQRNFRAP